MAINNALTALKMSDTALFTSSKSPERERERERERVHLFSFMASTSLPDIWSWINNLPRITQWKTNIISICICPTKPSQPSLNFSVTQNLQNTSLTFSIYADFHIPISLWTSKPFKNANVQNPIHEDVLINLFYNFINDVLNYGPNENTPFLKFHKLRPTNNFNDLFNRAFYTLTLLICIYEAPHDLRSECLNALQHQLCGVSSRAALKQLMLTLGSNIEEQWMRSVNLAITNWIVEHHQSDLSFSAPSRLFSYSVSTVGLWKVQLYCPMIATRIETSHSALPDDRLLFSLRYQQLEGVIQLCSKVIFRQNWVDVAVNVDNVRCDVIQLASDALMVERGTGADEKHFPSRISLQLTPTLQTDVLSVSVTKSSDNPVCEIGVEKSVEGTFEPPSSHIGVTLTATETVTMIMKPWKFEQSVQGNIANLNWFLHDSAGGREVFSSRPPKMALFRPKAWFRDRYASAYRPFTKQGGVVFAGDEYGECVWWKVGRDSIGKTMEWEIRGSIWLTYWPNRHRTSYSETRRLEFRETLQLSLVKQG